MKSEQLGEAGRSAPGGVARDGGYGSVCDGKCAKYECVCPVYEPSNEGITTAARALANNMEGGKPWEEMDVHERIVFVNDAEFALEAAYPVDVPKFIEASKATGRKSANALPKPDSVG